MIKLTYKGLSYFGDKVTVDANCYGAEIDLEDRTEGRSILSLKTGILVPFITVEVTEDD